MARRVLEEVTCDKCGTDEGVVSYTITRGGKDSITEILDLCTTHGKPLEALLKLGASRPRSPEVPPATQRARGQHKVEVIELPT